MLSNLATPTAEQKRECVETVAHYAKVGWAIAADPFTPIGRLAALTAQRWLNGRLELPAMTVHLFDDRVWLSSARGTDVLACRSGQHQCLDHGDEGQQGNDREGHVKLGNRSGCVEPARDRLADS